MKDKKEIVEKAVGTDLITAEDINPVTVFTAEGIEPIIKRIEEAARAHVPDVSTAKGRQEIVSLSYKIKRSKTLIDDIGKAHTADFKKQIKISDEARKIARDRLTPLSDEIRLPVTEWEEEEAKRKAEEARIEQERIIRIGGMISSNFGLDTAQDLEGKHSALVHARIQRVGAVEINLEDYQEFAAQAVEAKNALVAHLQVTYSQVRQKEEDDKRIAEEKARQEKEDARLKEESRKLEEERKKLADEQAAFEKKQEEARKEEEAKAKAIAKEKAEADARKEVAQEKLKQELEEPKHQAQQETNEAPVYTPKYGTGGFGNYPRKASEDKEPAPTVVTKPKLLHTPGPWREGKNCGAIVADTAEGLSVNGTYCDESKEYYGGYLIAETVASANKALIIEAPELLKSLEEMTAFAINERASLYSGMEVDDEGLVVGLRDKATLKAEDERIARAQAVMARASMGGT